jgi:hypothetical protein
MRMFDFGKLPFDRLTQLDVVDDAQDKERLDDLAEPLVILIVRMALAGLRPSRNPTMSRAHWRINMAE